jgi:hypothetical protein
MSKVVRRLPEPRLCFAAAGACLVLAVIDRGVVGPPAAFAYGGFRFVLDLVSASLAMASSKTFLAAAEARRDGRRGALVAYALIAAAWLGASAACFVLDPKPRFTHVPYFLIALASSLFTVALVPRFAWGLSPVARHWLARVAGVAVFGAVIVALAPAGELATAAVLLSMSIAGHAFERGESIRIDADGIARERRFPLRSVRTIAWSEVERVKVELQQFEYRYIQSVARSSEGPIEVEGRVTLRARSGSISLDGARYQDSRSAVGEAVRAARVSAIRWTVERARSGEARLGPVRLGAGGVALSRNALEASGGKTHPATHAVAALFTVGAWLVLMLLVWSFKALRGYERIGLDVLSSVELDRGQVVFRFDGREARIALARVPNGIYLPEIVAQLQGGAPVLLDDPALLDGAARRTTEGVPRLDGG